MEKGGQGEGGEEESKDNIKRRTGTGWRMVKRERVEKRRAVSKDNVERRTGRGWRKGK